MKLENLTLLERLFDISITVFELDSDLRSNVIWCFKLSYPTKLYFNLHENHFSLIKRVDQSLKRMIVFPAPNPTPGSVTSKGIK